MVKNKYSLVENLYNGKGLLLESGSGMGAQDLVAAYLIRHYPAVKTCRVAREKTNDEDVIGYDAKGNPIVQLEVKDITMSSAKYTGYAEVAAAGTNSAVSRQFQQDINWVHPTLLPQIPSKFKSLKQGWDLPSMQSANLALMKTRLAAIAPQVTSTATANPGKWVHSVLYGSSSMVGQVKIINANSISADTSVELFGAGHDNSALKTIAGTEPMAIYRGTFNWIKGAVTVGMKYNAKKNTMAVKLFKVYFGGVKLPPKERQDLQQYFSCYCTGQRSMKTKAGPANKLELGGISDTTIQTRSIPASWVVSGKGSPTYSQALTTKYSNDGDHYFCSVIGSKIQWCKVMGSTLPFLSKGVTKFTAVDSSGNVLPKGQSTVGEPFRGKSHAVHFVCDTIETTTGSAKDAITYRKQKKILDS